MMYLYIRVGLPTKYVCSKSEESINNNSRYVSNRSHLRIKRTQKRYHKGLLFLTFTHNTLSTSFILANKATLIQKFHCLLNLTVKLVKNVRYSPKTEVFNFLITKRTASQVHGLIFLTLLKSELG